ncbi:MAG: hypothetical protein ACRCX5_05290 [Bacteroidales bacterium]
MPESYEQSEADEQRYRREYEYRMAEEKEMEENGEEYCPYCCGTGLEDQQHYIFHSIGYCSYCHGKGTVKK